MSVKSLWIELDSVHSAVLHQAASDGKLPNLERLMASGGTTPIDYEVPLQMAAWATAHTGLALADHGAFGFERAVPGTYRLRVDLHQVEPDYCYWQVLGAAGKRVLVANSVNPILTPRINGIQLSNWSIHVTGRAERASSFPPDIAADLRREFPRDVFATADCGSDRFVDGDRLVAAISANLARKVEVYKRLIDREDWDHVHLGLDDLHNLGHVLWTDDGDADVAAKRLFDTAIAEVDAAIGALIEHARPSLIMVLSLGGIGLANTWSHMVDQIIARFESGKAPGRTLYGSLGRIWSAQPPWLKSLFLPWKSQLREIHLSARRARRCAFAMPLNEESGGIRFNLKGREPDGIVSAGEDQRKLAEDLRAAFLELRDTRSGLPLVTKVHYCADNHGDEPDRSVLPDMLIEWNRVRRMEEVTSERLGTIKMEFWPSRSGDHHVDGWMLSDRPVLMGNGQETVSVFDLAPTIAAVLGVGRDKRWRGSVLTGLLEPVA